MKWSVDESFSSKNYKRENYVNYVWHHEANVANDLMQVTLAQEDILNELIHAPCYDMQQSCSNYAEDLSRRDVVLLVGQMKDESRREKLSQLWSGNEITEAQISWQWM